MGLLPLLRGTTELADCANCPYSNREGKANNPVVSEYPENPAFLLVGDHPGRNETLMRRPFVGETGKIVEKMLLAAGRARDQVFISNAILCLPTNDDPGLKEQAARACSMRLKRELRKFPGKPILTLGSVAARAIIPKATLDAIDPPEVGPSHKRKQKDKQGSLRKEELRQQAKLLKLQTELFDDYLRTYVKTQSWGAALAKDLSIRFPLPKPFDKKSDIPDFQKDQRRKKVHEAQRQRQLGTLDYIAKFDETALEAIKQRVDRELEENTIEAIWARRKLERAAKKTVTKEEKVRRDAWVEVLTRSGLCDQKALTKAQIEKVEAKLGKENPTLLTKLREEATRQANQKLVALSQVTEEQLRIEADHQQRQAEGKRKKKSVGITDIAGTVFRVDPDGTGVRVVIPTINPAAIMRSSGRALLGAHTPDLAFWNVVSDAAKLNAISLGKDIFLDFPTNIEFESSEKAADLFFEFYRRALDEGSFALDLETYVEDPDRHHALMAYKAKIRAIGLATNDWAMSVLWDLLPSWCLGLLKYLLLSKCVTPIFHNRLYDATVLAAQGFPNDGDSKHFNDSLLQHHVTFPGAAHGLQSVTAQFYGVTPWKSEFRNNEETPEKLLSYCLADTHSTKKINTALTVWIQRTQTERIYDLDKKMSIAASTMHLDGVPVNREKNQELLTQFVTARNEARGRVESLANDPDNLKLIWHHLALEQARKQRKTDPDSFTERHKLRMGDMGSLHEKGRWNWKISANQHIAALLRALGVQLTITTAHGATKVNKEILEGLVEVPIVREVLRFRENDKLISTFISPLFDRELADGSTLCGFADEDDRVHPIWSIHKISGRWGSSDPVCSNIPKAKIRKMPDGSKKILRPNIRAQYVTRKGRKFVGFDFSQLEARILAMISKDYFLCDVFGRGLDIHREAARIIWPEFDTLNESLQKQLRDNAKPFEYGAFYGADPSTLYKQLLKEGYQIKEEDVFKAYFTLMGKLTGVAKYQQQIVEFASKPPFTLSTFLMGRRRVFPLGNAERNECLNWPVQCLKYDQHVLTLNGWIAIETLDPAQHALIQPSGNTTHNYEKVASGTKKLFEIITCRRRLVVSADHRFLVKGEEDKVSWEKLKDITVGDWIAVHEEVAPVDVHEFHVNEEQAEMLGALFGNGYYRTRGFHICSGSKKYIQYICQLASKVFGGTCNFAKSKDGTWRGGMYSKSVSAKIADLGLPLASKRNKRIPTWLEQAPTKIQIAFLRGMFDTDGGAYIPKARSDGRSSRSGNITFTSCIESAVRAVHRTLLRLGIDNKTIETFSYTPAGKRNKYYRCMITSYDRQKFIDMIDFRHPDRKKAVRSDLLPLGKHPTPPSLATWIGNQIRARRGGGGWKSAVDCARVDRAVKGHSSVGMLYTIINEAAEHGADITGLHEAVDAFRYDEVIEIREVPAAQTFDLSINEKDHTYVAEGILTHNSAGADIMNFGLSRMMERITSYKQAFPVLQIHDAAVFECWEDDAEDLLKDVIECFTQEYSIDGVTIRFPIDAKLADSWADL